MIEPSFQTTSRDVTAEVEHARVRLALAKTSVNAARRLRKETKEAARRAKKRLKRVKEEYAKAKRALAETKERFAREAQRAVHARKRTQARPTAKSASLEAAPATTSGEATLEPIG